MFFPGMNIAPGVDNFTNLLRQGYKDSLDMELAREKLAADQAQNDALMNYRMEMLAQRDKEAFVPVPETAVQTMINPLAAMSAYSAGFEGRPGFELPRITPEMLQGTPFRYNEQGQIVAPREIVPEVMNTQRSVIGSSATAFQTGAKQKSAAQLAKEASDRFTRGLESKEKIAGQADKTRLTIAQMQQGLAKERLAVAERIAKLRAQAASSGKDTAVLDSLQGELKEAEATNRTLIREWTQGFIPELKYRENLKEQEEKIKTIKERMDRERARLGEAPAPKAPAPKAPSADMKARFEAWYSSNKTKLDDRGVSKQQAEASYYNRMSK